MNLLFLAQMFCSLSVTSHFEMLLQILGDLETFALCILNKNNSQNDYALNSKCLDRIDDKDFKISSIIIFSTEYKNNANHDMC